MEEKVVENERLHVLESRFECPICLLCLKDPILTTCGHRFCGNCIHKWLKDQNGSCPIDGQVLSINNDLFPDNYTKREIAHQKVTCPVNGCTQELPLIDAENHIAESHELDTAIKCVFHYAGCTEVFTNPEQLKSHLEIKLYHHMKLLSTAYNRLNSRMDSHINDTKEKEARMWNPEPKQNEEHEASQNLIRTLYERIILLEQSNREHEIQLAGLKTNISELIEENINLKVEWPLRYCNGIYVWTINHFTKKYASMVEDHSTIFYSPGFYTSYVGYRFCARLNLCVHNRNYFTFLIHLMQGEADSVLNWPFCGRISFTLIHPNDPEKSVKETMMSRPELEAFKQPNREISTRGFGYNEFVLASDVFKLGFLNNDCITIKVQVHAV